MRLVLAVLVLCACGGAPPVAVENRGGTASTSCDLPARLELEARRYANVDADDKDYQTWSAWRVGIQLARGARRDGRGDGDGDGDRDGDGDGDRDGDGDGGDGSNDGAGGDRLRGTIAMVGDELVWSFDVAGRLDRARCTLELWTDTHEPMRVVLDLRTRTGSVRAIDDAWLLGPPFPVTRP